MLIFVPAFFLALTFAGPRGAFGEPVGGVWLGCTGLVLFPFLSLVLPFALAFERKDVSRAEAWKEGLIIMAAAIGISFAGLVFGFLFFGVLGG
jgi:hypothetical protein